MSPWETVAFAAVFLLGYPIALAIWVLVCASLGGKRGLLAFYLAVGMVNVLLITIWS